MKRFSLLAACVGVSAIFSVASAGEDPSFSFTTFENETGLIPIVGSNGTGISVFPLTMDPAHSDPGYPIYPQPMLGIQSLELVLTGLTHTNAADLDIYLIDPFGKTLEIMTDRGNGFGLPSVNLVFNDGAAGLPPENAQILSGTYLPEDSNNTGGFSKYNGGSGGTDAWILLVIDDSPGDQGGLQSYTLRGTVPEPVSLSLLALGALTALRRSRRKG
ncbi:MAG: PEP-CTERM sorting domain-containing protein [Phycisphaerales bacterium]|nr:PEP-CTERM sorting domain-containing protein [Phycisphaerales bacterium]